MPSQLYTNEAIDFVCARNFTYDGVDYKLGDVFPNQAKNIETLVRTRHVIPVVDSWDDKPRHWHREVKIRDEVYAKLNVDDPRNETMSEFDPGEHRSDIVVTHVEENPDDLERVIEMEEAGKNRSTLLAKLYALLEAREEEETNE